MVFPQNFNVKSFEVKTNDVRARTDFARYDYNNHLCAIVRVQILLDDVSFSENFRMGEPIRKKNEYWVYLAEGAKYLEIIHPRYFTEKVEFSRYGIDQLQGGTVYLLIVDNLPPEPVNNSNENKINDILKHKTFILPEFGYSFSPQFSAGIMVGGVYKKIGWYLKSRVGFSFQSEDATSDSSMRDFFLSGDVRKKMVIGIGGITIRIPRDLCLNIGGGYGSRSLLYGTLDKKWIKNTDFSYDGLAADISLLYLMKHFSIDVGISTISFKQLDVEIGVGFNF